MAEQFETCPPLSAAIVFSCLVPPVLGVTIESFFRYSHCSQRTTSWLSRCVSVELTRQQSTRPENPRFLRSVSGESTQRLDVLFAARFRAEETPHQMSDMPYDNDVSRARCCLRLETFGSAPS